MEVNTASPAAVNQQQPSSLSLRPDLDQIFAFKTYPAAHKVRKYVLVALLVTFIFGITTFIAIRRSNATPKIHDPLEDNNVSDVEIAGTYRLDRFDSNFPQLLTSLGIHQHVQRYIMASKEIYEIKEPSQADPHWTWTVHRGT